MNPISPFTKTDNTELICEYNTCITSDTHILNKHVENRICLDTGIIYNASGARGKENEFYTDEYDLHSENSVTEFTYFDQGKQIGVYENIIEFISSSIKLKDSGKALDIGCGKGLLLNRFNKKHPQWDLYAIEPSKNAIPFFKEVMPQLNVFNGNFEDSTYINEKFDFVMASGVLEHVPDPFAFMRSFANCMSDDAYGFIGVPNFETNPTDLFTYDHLSRFTPETINCVFEAAGLKIVSSLATDTRVPMWYVFKKERSDTTVSLAARIEKSRKLSLKSLKFIDSAFKSYNSCKGELKQGEKLAVYGMGAIGLLAFQYSKLKQNDVYCFIDDNPTIWGTNKNGIPVKSNDAILSENITSIVISANPCYIKAIETKINDQIKNTSVKLFSIK